VRSVRVDTTPPQVSAVDPVDGAKVAARGKPIVVEFSEPVQTGSFSYHVTPSLTDPSLSWSTDRRTVSIEHAVFGKGVLFTVTVLAAEDDAGWALEEAHSWSFTTAMHEIFVPAVLRKQ
jgi:hypothetical protein